MIRLLVLSTLFLTIGVANADSGCPGDKIPALNKGPRCTDIYGPAKPKPTDKPKSTFGPTTPPQPWEKNDKNKRNGG